MHTTCYYIHNFACLSQNLLILFGFRGDDKIILRIFKNL
jgi:hypothetical protein